MTTFVWHPYIRKAPISGKPSIEFRKGIIVTAPTLPQHELGVTCYLVGTIKAVETPHEL